MGRLLGLLLCTCSPFLFVPAFATGTDAVPSCMQDFSQSQAHLSVTRVSRELTSISIESPTVATQQVIVDYQTYQAFSISGEYSRMQEGSPSVPQVSRFYRIPNTGGADLAITSAEYDVVDDINPFPVQTEEAEFVTLRRDEAVYSQDGWYPANIAEMSEPMIMRDFRLVVVTLYPVQVNPVTHQARIYRRLSVDLVANSSPGMNELTNPHRPSGEWAPIYRSVIPNLEDNALDGMTTTPGSYMIVTSTNSNIRPWADSLAEWKTRKGYKVIMDARSSVSSASQIISDIQTAYANSDPPLEYVCLMGDPGWSNVGVTVDNANLDHSYGNMTPGDNIEDIGVGRLSGQSSSTMATINAKIMQYERTPHMWATNGAADTTWYHKSFLYAGTSRQVSSNYLIMLWARDQFRRHTNVYLDSVRTHSGDNVVVSDVTSQINGGIGYFLWRGTWEFGMPNSIADGTNPGGRLPITMTITCGAGDYSGSGINSPAEDFLCAGTQTNPKGGVSGVGTSTIGTQNGANGILTSGLIYAITDAGVEHLGTAVASAKAQLYSAYGPNFQDTSPYSPHGPIALHFTQFFNLLGDPGLSIWTDVPESLAVTYPTTLNVGARSVGVTVHSGRDNRPIQDALVVLWKRSPDSTWVRGLTDAQGNVTLPVSVNTTGGMYLTVTRRNCEPFLYTIPCGQVDCMPMYSSVVLDDDNTGGTQGNGDHIMNPGETIDLPVYVRNFGNVTQATDVSAVLNSSDPHVSVVNSSSVFPSIAPGDSAISATPFRIHVDAYMRHREQALLTITINSSAGQTVGTIPLTCYAGEALYMREWLSSALNPGATSNLTVVLKNTGAMPMSGVSGQLSSLTPFVHVDVSAASFGDITAGALDSNATSPFTLTANALSFRGMQAPMQLVLNTTDGSADTVLFNVSVGTAAATDPTGPDAYGYYAYDNTDVAYDLHPTYAYADISANGGTNLNLNDPGEKTAWNANYSAARRLPFGFKFYGQVYDSITICSNGWCAFGNQSYLDMFRHYQIPAMGAPDALIAAYFTDLMTNGTGKGVWAMADTANHRYIIQWKANGWSNPCTPEEGSPGSHFSTPLDFEVILYDSTYVPTGDGNGQVVMQYNQVTMNLNSEYCDEPAGCTIGIQKPGNVVGLQYAYQDIYSPGAATVSTGRAILYSTDHVTLGGSIRGSVVDFASLQPLAGASVSVVGQEYHAVSDDSGHFTIPNISIGTYYLTASFHRFNTDTLHPSVYFDSTTTVVFYMHHPEMALSADSLSDSLGASPGQTTFSILNSGNGPLDCNIEVVFPGARGDAPWDSVGDVAATQLTGNSQLWGCEFADNTWWITGTGTSGNNLIYHFDHDGNLLGSMPQPSNDLTGWTDMAYDGHRLYGSSSQKIYGIGLSGQLVDSIPSPLSVTSAIAYDSLADHFWIAHATSDIYEIDRAGNVILQRPNTTGLNITGLAWDAADPDGFKLYIFSQNGSVTDARLTRMMVTSPFSLQTVVDLPGLSGDRAGGCTITPGWNNLLVVFAGMMNGPGGADHMELHQVSFNHSWINVTPAQTAVPGGGNAQITAHFDPASLRSGYYRVDLRIASSILDTTMILPVHVIVNRGNEIADPYMSSVPTSYALHQNFPNPFNPTTIIRYELKRAGVTRLSVFNLLGEKVADLVNAAQPAGYYDVTFDASELPSGVYFYRLSSGSFVRSAKMILMK